MDSYQAVYDAVRSRIGGANIGEAVERAVRDACDASRTIAILQQEFGIAAAEMARPSVLYRPSLGADGSKWCALYGDDLATGVAGFGDTPEEAMTDFDAAWRTQRTPAVLLSQRIEAPPVNIAARASADASQEPKVSAASAAGRTSSSEQSEHHPTQEETR